MFHAPDRSARECATLNAEKDSHNIFPQWYVVIRRLVPIPASIVEVRGGGAGGVTFPKDRFMQSMSCKGSYDSEWYIIFSTYCILQDKNFQYHMLCTCQFLTFALYSMLLSGQMCADIQNRVWHVHATQLSTTTPMCTHTYVCTHTHTHTHL